MLIRQWICVGWALAAVSVLGAPVSLESALNRALEWMSGNPVMSTASQVIDTVTVFPDAGTYSVYVVQLEPKGYLILNSDDRLPLLVSFSAESLVDLSDHPQNTLRAMLLGYCEKKTNELADWHPVRAAMAAAVVEDELYGPFLETSWNQNTPYNDSCPSGAPVGCVPTAFAQLMNYHRWPYYGSGSRSYTDDSGSNTGTHSADFSNVFGWENMKVFHSSGDSQEEKEAISELMFELGVAAGVNYESGGTSGNSTALGSSLGEYAYYDTIRSYDAGDGDDIISPMEADLRAGFPCVVAYPGHAFVADGLMVSGGLTTYHFNMGWGGYNNGWYASDAAPSGSGSAELDECISSFRPQLMAFPQTNSVSGEGGGSAEVKWILPRRLEDEVSSLTVKQLVQQPGGWASDASEITGMSCGWDVVDGGRSGSDCWYGGDYGVFSMVLKEVFVPDADALLTFWKKYTLYNDLFAVSVSSDGGASYSEIFSEQPAGSQGWTQESVSLSAYAGQKIRIKFSLRVDGTYYPGGGVWLDDLAVTSGEWYDWETFAEDTTLASRRFSEQITVLDDCDDFSVFEETKSGFSADWVVSTTEGVDHCFYKAAPTAWNYGCHLTSLPAITPTSATRLVVRAKYSLASSGNPEYFKILVSDDRSDFAEIWSANGTADWSDIVLDLAAYAGNPIYIRLAYEFSGSYVPGGGIWIDSICTQEVTNPELEGQPVHYTALTDLPVGTHTLAAVLTDTDSVEHAVGPAFTLTVSGMPDDGDGMPMDWENRFGLDPEVDDGGLDPDGDGFSNYQEYIAGTVPTNGVSAFALVFNSGPLPSFEGVSGRRYRIEYCDGLVSNSWQELVSDVPGASGWIRVDQFDDATNGCRFYRVHVELSE